MFIVQQTGKMVGNDKVRWVFRAFFKNAVWEYTIKEMQYRGAEISENVRKMDQLPFSPDKWAKTDLNPSDWLHQMETFWAISELRKKAIMKAHAIQQAKSEEPLF